MRSPRTATAQLRVERLQRLRDSFAMGTAPSAGRIVRSM
jgi:hypothetical protein